MMQTRNRILLPLLLAAVTLQCTTAFVPSLSERRTVHVSQHSPTSTTQLFVGIDSKLIQPPVRVPTSTRNEDAQSNSNPTATATLAPSDSSTSSFTSANPVTQFSQFYQRLTSEHYLAMAFLQAGVLASCADMATQTMESGSIHSVSHVMSMALVASTMSGAMNAVWLRQLEEKFPGKSTQAVVSKTMIHAVILASIINSAYLVGVPLFTQHLFPAHHHGDLMTMLLHHPTSLLQHWSTDQFITLTKLEICMFIPYNTLAFQFVPPSIRPLTHAMISATFNVAVSAVTLGYFDTWVERASTMVQHVVQS